MNLDIKEDNKDVLVNIFNIQGKLLEKIEINNLLEGNYKHKIDLNHFTKGIYLIKTFIDNQTFESKLIKK